MGPRHDLSFCAYKTAWLASELLVSMSPISHVWFLDSKQRLLDPNNKSLWVPDITCRCVHENSVIRTRILSLYVSQTSSVVLSTHNCVLNTKMKRLYWFQPSPVVLCMQNSDFRTRITSLCGSKTPPVDFVCKPATFGPKLNVSMSPRTHLWFSACKTRCLASELLVSMGPSPHLWFLHSKQRPLEPNNKSLRVADITCRFVHKIQRD